MIELSSTLSKVDADASCPGSGARVSLDDEHSALICDSTAVHGGRAEDSLYLLRVIIEQAEQESLLSRVEDANHKVVVEQSQQFHVACGCVCELAKLSCKEVVPLPAIPIPTPLDGLVGLLGVVKSRIWVGIKH